MDPQEYLTLARHLDNRPRGQPEEACRRSACSRAYYAAYVVARDTLLGLPVQIPRSSTHRAVIDVFKASKHSDVRIIGGQLETLRDWRNTADYDVGVQTEPGGFGAMMGGFSIAMADAIIRAIRAEHVKDARLGIPR
jgi:hypothetical protein